MEDIQDHGRLFVRMMEDQRKMGENLFVKVDSMLQALEQRRHPDQLLGLV